MTYDDSFVDWITDPLAEDGEYRFMERELKKDFRKNKQQYSDINGYWDDFRNFRNSEEYKQTIRAKDLLSDIEVNASDFRNTLQSAFGYSNQDCDRIFKNLGNSKDVYTHVNPYNRNVTLRRKLDV